MYKINFIPTSVFEILKVLIDSLSMPNHTHLKSHHQFVALIDICLHAKTNFTTPIVFEILKFKNPSI